MFGGYDPAYNPESLEKAKAENKELSPQQQEMADKWAAAMDDHEVAPDVAQAAAESAIAAGDPNVATEIVAEAAATEAAQETPEEAVESEEADLEEQPESEQDEDGKGGPRRKFKHTDAKPGQDVNQTSTDATIENMKTLTPAGAVVADAVTDAITITEQGLNEGVGINQVADFVENVHTAAQMAKDGEGGDDSRAPEEAGEEETTAEQQPAPSTEIQHFNAGDNDTSSFQPLSPEEQRAQAQAVTEVTAPDGAMSDLPEAETRYDSDNLVAQAVAENSGKGSIDLNSIGSKLEGDGVDIADEVADMKADIANDVTESGTDGSPESAEEEAATAEKLAVDAAATALAVKEKAADTASAIENGSATADTQSAEFTQAAAELDTLIDTAENSATESGTEVSEKVAQARKLSEEAKTAVSEAQSEADAAESEEAAEEEKKDDGKPHEGGDDEFNSDNYPELKDLEKGDRQSIFA
jgi:hypothetical protein